ncbi:SigE family RNA polymerase sigma factor [Propionibacteriaceae bacterium Y1923]|uniref:SigE family RNA polymerase sigma factor n=1 Tax=Aestuariimicrobium sp. Y1814 TaxID=3418742 RepID=UPI003C24F2EB
MNDADASFVAFVDERSPELMRVALHLTRNQDEALDLVQTSLERAYRKWKSIDPAQGAYGYVRQIMVNAHTDGQRRGLRWMRKSGVRDGAHEVAMSDGELHLVTPDGRSPETVAITRDEVRRNLDRLTTRERAAVVLRYGEDLSEAEVADHLGISVGTVKSTVSRALAKLRVAEAATMGGMAR